MRNQLNILLYIIICSSTFSCSVAKKNIRAVNRVKADVNLLNDVGDVWQKLNPCKINIPIQYIYGGRVIVYDTLNTVDTIVNTETNVQTVYKTVSKLVKQIDTLKIYVTDQRALNNCINNNNTITGQITQLKSDISSQYKYNNRLRWWIA